MGFISETLKSEAAMKKFWILVLIAGLGGVMVTLVGQDYSDKNAFEFSHKQHVIEEEIECADCHGAAEQSRSGLDNLLPARSVCLDCHEQEELGNFDRLYAIDTYSEKFSHQQHIAADVNCESCHSAVAQKTAAFPYVLPTMVECMECHEVNAVALACQTCHKPLENLRPISHTRNFLHNHGDQARMAAMEVSADMACAVCHSQQFCQDCHEGENLDRFAHPLNYEFTHALEAQNKERECAVCHTERSFCVSCHRDNHVLPRNHTTGWVNNFPNDGGRHSVEARNDLDACISCHEQNAQAICQPCHAN